MADESASAPNFKQKKRGRRELRLCDVPRLYRKQRQEGLSNWISRVEKFNQFSFGYSICFDKEFFSVFIPYDLCDLLHGLFLPWGQVKYFRHMSLNLYFNKIISIFYRANNAKINFREKEKKVLDQILGQGKYDARIRPSGINGTGKLTIIFFENFFI